MKRSFQFGFLLLVALAIPRPASAALGFAQACNNFGAASTSSLVITCSTSAGSLLVLGFRQGSNNTALSGVTDSAGQTWTQIAIGSTGWDASTQGFMYYMANSSAVTSVTVNLGAANTNRAAVVFEITGAATSSPEDSSVKNSTASLVNSLTTAALTTTNANDILIDMTYLNGSRTGWAAAGSYTLPSGGQDSTGRIAMSYLIVGATQSGVTTSMSWGDAAVQAASIFAGFKEAAAGGGGAAPPMMMMMGVGD